jgi:acetolactate synthase-1/2/3 large subunit
MNGAEAILRTAKAAGVEVCFANPGTTEMHIVGALDAVPEIRPVLGLFEGVCTGAADGYARMTARPALTLLHLGPGFANGIANLHNARRANSPVVNLVGDHATWHLAADAPLTSDIESLARPVGWVRQAGVRSQVTTDFLDAVDAATGAHPGVATLIVPQDVTWEDGSGPAPPRSRRRFPPIEARAIDEAARALGAGHAAVLFLGGQALGERGLSAAAQIGARTGCRIFHETFVARLERGGGLPGFTRLPYFPEQASAALADAGAVVLAGTRAPVAFFGYPDLPSRLVPEACAVTSLVSAGEDVEQALEALAERLGGGGRGRAVAVQRPAPPTGRLTAETFAQAIASLQPEGAIVVDEAATSGILYFDLAAAAPRHSLLTLTGGAIGQGLPCAVGAAIACPGRRVIALQADGSGMFTLQALWTMARESLDVTVVVCANRRYRILQLELARAGVHEPGRKALSLTELSPPVLEWTALAQGMGVPATSVDTAEGLAQALRRSLAEPGPTLIEALLE